MTPSARDAIVRVHGRLEAHDGIHLEQRDRRRRALEIDLLEHAWRQHVRVHFEPDLQRGRRIDAFLDDLVQAKRVGPQLLVAERVEAEDALALGDKAADGFSVAWDSRQRRARCLGRRLRCSAILASRATEVKMTAIIAPPIVMLASSDCHVVLLLLARRAGREPRAR